LKACVARCRAAASSWGHEASKDRSLEAFADDPAPLGLAEGQQKDYYNALAKRSKDVSKHLRIPFPNNLHTRLLRY
jgi:hypothetical protein